MQRSPKMISGLARRRLRVTTITVLAIILTLISVVPFLYVVSAAFKNSQSLFTYPPQWLPKSLYLDNFRRLFDDGFGGWAVRTLIVSAVATAVKLAVDSMAAYAFATMRFPGRNTIFVVMVLTVLIPPVALIIPLYFMVRDLGGLNSYWAVMVPTLANPVGIVMLRGFIQTLPGELEQAGKVDGASSLRIWWHIVLPAIRPGLIVVGLYLFLVQYTSFVWPLVVSPDKPLITSGLATLKSTVNVDWGALSAGALLAMVPITIIFLAFQRKFISSGVTSGIKG